MEDYFKMCDGYIENMSVEITRLYILDIYYIVSYKNYSFCFDAKRRVFMMKMKIGDLQKYLPSKFFIRSHKEIIVNLRHVKRLLPYNFIFKIHFILLKNKIKVGCSRRQTTLFKVARAKFLHNTDKRKSDKNLNKDSQFIIFKSKRNPGSDFPSFFSLS